MDNFNTKVTQGLDSANKWRGQNMAEELNQNIKLRKEVGKGYFYIVFNIVNIYERRW